MIAPFPDKKYKTILVDPPWRYGVWGKCKGRGGKLFQINCPLPYASMTVDEIKVLPVRDIAEDNCDVYLWATQKYLPEAFCVLDAWEFKYCQILTWCKTPRGTGQGGLYTPTTEFLLLGRRGKMPKHKRLDTTWWHIKRQRYHSQKPEDFQDIIETVSDAPRIELFARREREGWDVWGDEVPSGP